MQALLRNRQRFSIITRVQNQHPHLIKEAHHSERDLMNLALLPSEFNEEAFEDLNESLIENEELYEIMRRWFNYYRGQWLSKTGPTNYSVYMKSARSNNLIERYHRTFKVLTATRPEIVKFFGELTYRQLKKRFYVVNCDFHICLSTCSTFIWLKYRLGKNDTRELACRSFVIGPRLETAKTSVGSIKKTTGKLDEDAWECFLKRSIPTRISHWVGNDGIN